MKYAVYALLDPRSGSIRYIGLSWKPRHRYSQHLNDQRNLYKASRSAKQNFTNLQLWLIDLAKNGLTPLFKVIWWIKPKGNKALHLERSLITQHSKRNNLVNTVGLSDSYVENVRQTFA